MENSHSISVKFDILLELKLNKILQFFLTFCKLYLFYAKYVCM